MSHTRIVFMGSPDFAVPILRRLAAEYQVVGVVSQPDRAAGRGQTLQSPPVKRAAQELGLEIIQPERLRQPEALARLQAWAPDLVVVAAFGQILKPAALELPRFGCINVHASLLPRWRGAAPIQAAILSGDSQSGVTIMKMEAGLDTGPILLQRAIALSPQENGGSLFEKLASLGATLLLEAIPPYLRGELLPQAQAEQGVTYAAMLKKEDGLLDFTRPAEELERRARAMFPWPGAFFLWRGAPLKVLRAHLAPAQKRAAAGTPTIFGGLPALHTATDLLVLDELQPAGKRPMPAKAFLSGARDWAAEPGTNKETGK